MLLVPVWMNISSGAFARLGFNALMYNVPKWSDSL